MPFIANSINPTYTNGIIVKKKKKKKSSTGFPQENSASRKLEIAVFKSDVVNAPDFP